MKIYLVIFLLLSIGIAYGQNQKVNPVRFSSVNNIGVVTGAHRDAPVLQTINGIAIENWSAGIGIGFDGYSERSIPLFLDVRKDFGSGNNIPFAYMDGGINFGWLNFFQNEHQSFPDYTQPSWYYDAGLGWKIPLSAKTGFIITAGYSMKQLAGDRTAYRPGTSGQPFEYKEAFKNTYRRISIKLGIHL